MDINKYTVYQIGDKQHFESFTGCYCAVKRDGNNKKQKYVTGTVLVKHGIDNRYIGKNERHVSYTMIDRGQCTLIKDNLNEEEMFDCLSAIPVIIDSN